MFSLKPRIVTAGLNGTWAPRMARSSINTAIVGIKVGLSLVFQIAINRFLAWRSYFDVRKFQFNYEMNLVKRLGISREISKQSQNSRCQSKQFLKSGTQNQPTVVGKGIKKEAQHGDVRLETPTVCINNFSACIQQH